MTATILVIARELTVGGAAYLAVRHLQRLAVAGREIDLLVTGPVTPRMAGELPAGVRLSRLDLGPVDDAAGLLAIHEAIAAAEHPFLADDYDAVVGTSLFPEVVPCAAFHLARGRRKLLVLLDEGLLGLPDPPPDLDAAMRSAVLAADHLVPVSQGLLDTLARRWPELLEIPATVIPPPIDPPAAVRPSPFPPGPTRLPRVVTEAVAVGEATGTTAEALDRVADHLAEASIRGLAAAVQALGFVAWAAVAGLVVTIVVGVAGGYAKRIEGLARTR